MWHSVMSYNIKPTILLRFSYMFRLNLMMVLLQKPKHSAAYCKQKPFVHQSSYGHLLGKLLWLRIRNDVQGRVSFLIRRIVPTFCWERLRMTAKNVRILHVRADVLTRDVILTKP